MCRWWLCRLQITETLFLNELKINFICFIASIQHMRLNDRFLLLFKKKLLSYSWFIMLCLFLMYSSDSVIHICIFSYSFILRFITDTEYSSPCHNSRNLLVIHYIYNSLHLLIPNSPKLCFQRKQRKILPNYSWYGYNVICSTYLSFKLTDCYHQLFSLDFYLDYSGSYHLVKPLTPTLMAVLTLVSFA